MSKLKLYKFIVSLLITGIILIHFACDKQKKLPKNEKKNIFTESEQTQINQFAYVALAYGKPSIYKYNIEKNSFELFWYDQSDFVITLNTNYSTSVSFFITAKKVGQKANFPFISNIELYRIDPELSKVDFIDDIGNAMQLNAYWNDEGNFELVYTDIDKSISSYINKFTLKFNSFGKIIDDKVETFDLEKTGFPLLLPKKISTKSASGQYGISEVNDSVYIKFSNNANRFITVINGSIAKAGWNNTEEYLFFSTTGTGNDFRSTELFVYNIEGDSLVTSWSGEGRKDFFTAGELLIFEDGLGENSYLNVYNFEDGLESNRITRKGGSGLKNIPEKKR